MLSIDEMLRRSARDRPAAEAVASRTRRMSFAELDARSDRMATFLIRNGLEGGDRVAILSPKCLEEVISIFAIAKAGGVLVDINPAFRAEKIRHVLMETEPAALLVHASKRPVIQGIGATPKLLIQMGRNAADIAQPPAKTLDSILRDSGTDDPPRTVRHDPAELAAIIYTSGTTSSSKGIMVTHGILSDATVVSAELLGNAPSDRLISVTPFSFDGALSQLFTAVLAGGTLVLQDSSFPKDIIQTLVAEKITGFHAMPSLWRMILARHPELAGCELPHLRYLSLIGEVFPEDELMKLRHALPGTEFYMMYGTTEAFRSTCLPPVDFERKKGSVGLPLPGVEIAIIADDGRPCKAGEVGEIVHRGAFVSSGYWRRDGSGIFREDGVHTGDLGRLDTEGYLYFVHRKDSMIKRLGYQVYPEEIETCLQRMQGVSIAAVVPGPGDSSGPKIRAFVMPDSGSTISREAVAAHCKRHLPHYMMPDDIIIRQSIPLTGNWKIDRAGLEGAVIS